MATTEKSLWSKSEPVRLYSYGVLIPALALLAFKGWISHDEIALWLALGGAVLGVPVTEVVRAQTEAPATKAAALKAQGGLITVHSTPTPVAASDAAQQAHYLYDLPAKQEQPPTP